MPPFKQKFDTRHDIPGMIFSEAIQMLLYHELAHIGGGHLDLKVADPEYGNNPDVQIAEEDEADNQAICWLLDVSVFQGDIDWEQVKAAGYEFAILRICLAVSPALKAYGIPGSGKGYTGEVTVDRYGRKIPKHAHGTANLREYTASARMITDAVMKLYDRIVNPHLMVRRISMAANHVLDEKKAADKTEFRQLDLFTDFTGGNEKKQQDEKVEREKKMQEAVLSIKKKYGKNAILKGLNFQEGATTKERNEQIGGHKA